MALSTNHRGIWAGSAASIPTGWTRDTAFDGRFLQGWTGTYTGPANGGGNHSHTADAHTHIGDAHTHTMSGATATPGASNIKDLGTPAALVASPQSHSHSSAASASAVITYQNATVTVNASSESVAATDPRPPFMRAIIIQPADAFQEYPSGAVAFSDDAPPSGYSVADGTGGTVDLDGRYILGAAAAGDGGGTGGEDDHNHTCADHTHTANSHAHSAGPSGSSSGNINTTATGFGGFATVFQPAHHNVTLKSNASGTVNNATGLSTTDTSNHPDHVELFGIQNTSGAAATPDGLILPFVGTAEQVPAGWLLCDGSLGMPDLSGAQVQCIAAGTAGTRSGSNSHTHSGPSHNHTHAGTHGHTGTGAVTGSFLALTTAPTSAAINASLSPHTHTWTIGSTTPTIQSSTFTMDSVDKRWNYRSVLWVKKYTPPTTVHILGNTAVLGNCRIL